MTVHFLRRAGRPRPQPPHLRRSRRAPRRRGRARGRRRPGRDRRAGRARPPGRDAPDRVHRARLPGRVGVEGVPTLEDDARHAAARPASSRPSRLPEPMFTPSTKADRGPRREHLLRRGRRPRGQGDWPSRRATSASRPTAAARRAAERNGIIVADTKFELGFIDGELAMCDEILTPDSSRFWPADAVAAGHQPARPSTSSPCATGSRRAAGTRRPPPPPLPPEVVRRRRASATSPPTSGSAGGRLADWYGASR